MSLFEDRSGNIWIGTFDGLTKYNPDSNSGNAFTDFMTPFLTYYFAEDKDGNFYFSHSEKNSKYSDLPNQVLYKYDQKVTGVNAFIKIIEKDQPNDFQIFGKAVDKDGKIWFGTMHGPCKYDPEAEEGKRFTYFFKGRN